MQIEGNKVVTVTYRLEVSDGTHGTKNFVEEADANHPLTFLSGVGSMIPGFERQMEGMREGDLFNFSIEPEEGYGVASEDDIVELPYSVFADEAKKHPEMLTIGNIIPMNDGQGHQFEGKVKSVGTDTVTMDFNHPLAGKTLHFAGKIENLREASQEELDHGHVHGPGGHHH